MKKLLGLIAVAPMALAACGGEEAIKYDAVAYGSTHGATALVSDGEKVATGIAKAQVKLNDDLELSHVTINETNRVDTTEGEGDDAVTTKNYVFNSTYDSATMDEYGYRVLTEAEVNTAMDDYAWDITWKYGTDYMPSDANGIDDDGDKNDGKEFAKGWTASMDALMAYLKGDDLAEAEAKLVLLKTNDGTTPDWTGDVTGASAKMAHVHQYADVIIEAMRTATKAKA